MSKTRTKSPISDVDRIAEEEGLELQKPTDTSRSFIAFGRVFEIEEASAGKVGIFEISSTPRGATDEAAYEGFETHGGIRKLFRRSVAKERERVAA